jgi:hypothetical protein
VDNASLLAGSKAAGPANAVISQGNGGRRPIIRARRPIALSPPKIVLAQAAFTESRNLPLDTIK